MLLHTGTFQAEADPYTHSLLYTRALLHTTLSHTHKQTFLQTHTLTVLHKRFYIQISVRTDSFVHKRFYTERFLFAMET